MVSLRSFAVLLSALQAAVLAAPTKQVIPGRYVVTLKGGISARDVESHVGWVRDVHKRSLGSRGVKGVEKTFHIKDFNAYAGEFDEETLELIRSNPDAKDQIWTLFDAPAAHAEKKRALVTQDDAIWGLASISHRTNGSSQYIYDDSAGAGTYAYVIDSGVRISHDEFGGRASMGYVALPGVDDADNFGHGTHVAGTVAGATVGVAKRANVIGIKAFDAGVKTGMTNVLDAFNWAVDDIVSNGRQDKAVVVMSLGGVISNTFNNAVNSAFEAGVLSVVSAGNSNEDAGSWSPASAADAITVGATDAAWNRATFSNYGSVLDIFAPGAATRSAYYTSDDAYFTYSGTSMACPHVAGVALYLMTLEGGDAAAITGRILELATPDAIKDTKGSPNLHLYNGNGA
ncbi:hypothetical protein DL766_005223 [Monosporascus sp. MC13-8B]|uniref:Peptidase S8/S53 domain-containing protein n=1 Tax=Monosporascus cannonballus TaxID=155416 RepID=A0ABY0HGP2_9PEZI|nr:hypothetical protein DL762_001360 [Monosporascus cannonballus]RYP00407.1 hypothetical protein DL763_000873 [Monosporascus cannonballus]RYP29766.1 hypothetical protein DL766_005223 [Monosporascus sp. MC13-8B]